MALEIQGSYSECLGIYMARNKIPQRLTQRKDRYVTAHSF